MTHKSTADIVRDRLEMARKDEETRLAKVILARHTEEEWRKVWEQYVSERFVGPHATFLLKEPDRYPRLVADLLEPNALSKTMAATCQPSDTG